jgi:hypothetical protein
MQLSLDSYNFKSIPINFSEISFDLAEGYISELKELFFIEGKYAPIINWHSFSQSDWPKPQQIIFDYWRSHNTIETFNLADFDKHDSLKLIKPYIAVLETRNDDYIYSFTGNRYAFFHNFTQSKPISLLSILNNTQSAIDLLNYVILAACSIRVQGAICMYQSGKDTNPELWHKLILPLSSDISDAKRYIVCALKSP